MEFWYLKAPSSRHTEEVKFQDNMNDAASTLTSSNTALESIKYCFIFASGIYFLSIPFCRSRKSFWDVVAARLVVKIVKLLTLLQLIALLWLLYDVIKHGSPIQLNPVTQFSGSKNSGSNISWNYGYARPVSGMIFFVMGFFSDMHFSFRFCVMTGCWIQAVTTGLSAFQVNGYYHQVVYKSAPLNNFSRRSLQIYYWRDIFTLGLSMLLLYYILHLSILVGLLNRPFISYQEINGGDIDRCKVMLEQREQRKIQEMGQIERV